MRKKCRMILDSIGWRSNINARNLNIIEAAPTRNVIFMRYLKFEENGTYKNNWILLK
jgi:hypothetical protein